MPSIRFTNSLGNKVGFRHFVLVTHRWLGLGSSILVAIVGGTGALIVWTLPSRLRRIAGLMHTNLGMGRIGLWIVFAVTVVTALLVVGGLVLWWKHKIVRIRTTSGWRRALFDLHHALGFMGFVVMFVLTLTGIGIMVTDSDDSVLRRMIFDFHTTRGFPLWLKGIYSVGSAAFVVQVVTGIVMWWKPRRNGSDPRSSKLEKSKLELTTFTSRPDRCI